VLLSTYDSRGGVEPLVGLAVRLRELGAEVTTLTPETRARAAPVAGTIRADGAMVAATLLVDAISRERPPVPA
jgi:hypothetical protein